MLDLQAVTLLLTRRCNYHCSWCKISRGTLPGPELTPSDWVDVIEKLKGLGTTTFVIAGGEPTLRSLSLLRVLSAIAREPKATSILVSNGVFIARNADVGEKLLLAGLDAYSSSVDTEHRGRGLRQQDNGLGSYRLVDADNSGLASLRIMRELGCKDVTASLVLYRDNADTLADQIESLSDEGIWTVLSVLHAQADASAFEFRSEAVDALPTVGQVERFVASLLARWPRLKIHTPRRYFEKLPEVFRPDGCYAWHCAIPGRIEIDADGAFKPCPDTRSSLNVLTATPEELETEWAHVTHSCPGCYYACTAGAELRED